MLGYGDCFEVAFELPLRTTLNLLAANCGLQHIFDVGFEERTHCEVQSAYDRRTDHSCCIAMIEHRAKNDLQMPLPACFDSTHQFTPVITSRASSRTDHNRRLGLTLNEEHAESFARRQHREFFLKEDEKIWKSLLD